MAIRKAQSSHWHQKVILAAIFAVLGALAAFLLFSGKGREKQSVMMERAPTGTAQLISIEPLPPMDGEMCQWAPASATMSLRAALQQERLALLSQGVGGRAAPDTPDDATRTAAAKRKPLRMIRDPYSAFASVAVDPIRNEVVVTDENLFNILVYDRLENTPPTATLSEPKRIIGGVDTKIEFQCALYIDPKSGDIYAVNNDSVNTLVVFSRQAKGNVLPDRELETPHGTFGIAVDEEREEMFMAVQHDNAVVVFRKMAEGEESPIRLLQGDQTLLADPHGIALDLKTDRMFVTNQGSFHRHRPGPALEGGMMHSIQGKSNWPLSWGNAVPGSGKMLPPSITVYPRGASGDTPPLQVIQGPKTQMNWPTALAIDPERGELYVANDMGDSILVFSTSANGDAAPIRVLKGPRTLIKNPTGVFLDEENGELWTANFGNHTATVHNATASGDTPPLRVIRSSPLGEPFLGMGNPHPVAYDTKREEILVPN